MSIVLNKMVLFIDISNNAKVQTMVKIYKISDYFVDHNYEKHFKATQRRDDTMTNFDCNKKRSDKQGFYEHAGKTIANVRIRTR